jgi:hypothetical protein
MNQLIRFLHLVEWLHSNREAILNYLHLNIWMRFLYHTGLEKDLLVRQLKVY